MSDVWRGDEAMSEMDRIIRITKERREWLRERSKKNFTTLYGEVEIIFREYERMTKTLNNNVSGTEQVEGNLDKQSSTCEQTSLLGNYKEGIQVTNSFENSPQTTDIEGEMKP